jgi:branched-chain amino acid aminotransferase
LQLLEKVKEAFITSTTKAALPVLKINDRTIGNGKPGAITTKIYNKIIAAGKLL